MVQNIANVTVHAMASVTTGYTGYILLFRSLTSNYSPTEENINCCTLVLFILMMWAAVLLKEAGWSKKTFRERRLDRERGQSLEILV